MRTPEKERARLVRRVMRYYGMGEEPASALTEGLLDQEKGQPLEHLALLAVDWKGHDGFEYLAPYLVKTCRQGSTPGLGLFEAGRKPWARALSKS